MLAPFYCMAFLSFFFLFFPSVLEKYEKTCFYAKTNDFNQRMACGAQEQIFEYQALKSPTLDVSGVWVYGFQVITVFVDFPSPFSLIVRASDSFSNGSHAITLQRCCIFSYHGMVSQVVNVPMFLFYINKQISICINGLGWFCFVYFRRPFSSRFCLC